MKHVLIFFLSLIFFAFTSQAQTITTVVQQGGALGDGGPASVASVSYGIGICFDKHDNIYIADSHNHRIRKIDAITGIISTYAGTGVAGYGGDGGPATAAKLGGPVFITIDTAGNIYICDTTYRVRKVDAMTGLISTYAGNGTYGSTGNGGAATAAEINTGGMAFDNFGELHITDVYSIRKINSSGIISVVAGNGASATTLNNVPATGTSIYAATGICFDINNNLFFDDASCSIRKINYNNDTMRIVAGLGDTSCYPYSGDGIQATTAKMSSLGLVVDFFGDIFFDDASNNRIIKIDTFGILHTIAGNGTAAFSGDGGPATAAMVNYAEYITLDNCGNIYFSDFGNNRVRKITMPSNPGIKLYCPTASPVGSTVTVKAKVGNAGGYYTIKWKNRGIVFATTSSPVVTYTKTAGIDTITATVYGCSDSATSAFHTIIVGPNAVPEVLASEEISVYPNPAKDILYLESKSKACSYQLSSIIGTVLQVGSISPGKNYISLEGLPVGVYLLELAGENEKHFQRIIKE